MEQTPENSSIKRVERRVSLYLHHPRQQCSAPRGNTMAQDSAPHWEKEQPASQASRATAWTTCLVSPHALSKSETSGETARNTKDRQVLPVSPVWRVLPCSQGPAVWKMPSVFAKQQPAQLPRTPYSFPCWRPHVFLHFQTLAAWVPLHIHPPPEPPWSERTKCPSPRIL